MKYPSKRPQKLALYTVELVTQRMEFPDGLPQRMASILLNGFETKWAALRFVAAQRQAALHAYVKWGHTFTLTLSLNERGRGCYPLLTMTHLDGAHAHKAGNVYLYGDYLVGDTLGELHHRAAIHGIPRSQYLPQSADMPHRYTLDRTQGNYLRSLKVPHVSPELWLRRFIQPLTRRQLAA